MASTITVGDAAGKGEKEIMTRYPIEEGLTAGTQKQTGNRFLNTNVDSLVPSKDKIGL